MFLSDDLELIKNVSTYLDFEIECKTSALYEILVLPGEKAKKLYLVPTFNFQSNNYFLK